MTEPELSTLPGSLPTLQHMWNTTLPTILLITSCPLYLYYKRGKRIKANQNRLIWSKLAIAVVLFTLQITQLCLWTLPSYLYINDDWPLATDILSWVVTLYMGMPFSLEYSCRLRISTLLTIFVTGTWALELVYSASYFSTDGLTACGVAQAAVVIIKGLLLMTELYQSHTLDLWTTLVLGSTRVISLLLSLNRIIVITVYRLIALDRIVDLGREFSTEVLVRRFQRVWKRANKDEPHCLSKTIFRVHAVSVLLVVPPRLLFSICSFLRPFFIYYAVDVVRRKDIPTHEKHRLMHGALGVYGGVAVFRFIYSRLNTRTVALVRGTLMGCIFDKTLRISSQSASDSAALTHISNDIQSIASGIIEFHNLWIGVLELAFATYALSFYIGAASLLLFVPAIISTVWSLFFGPRVGAAQSEWNQKIEERVAHATKIFAQAKQIKMLGHAKILASYLQNTRVNELFYARRYRWLQTLVTVMVMLAGCFTPVIILGGSLFWTKISVPLEAAKVFTVLAFIALAIDPLYTILKGYAQIHELLSSFRRIQGYLIDEDKVDSRICETPSRSLQSARVQKPDIVTSDFVFFNRPIDMLITSISPTRKHASILQNVDLIIPRSQLTMAIGPTGSGKSILLKSILGEAHFAGGETFVSAGPIAYCDQRVWLRNDTIRKNIVGESKFNAAWYNTVIESCCLRRDFNKLEHRDRYVVGNGGSKLSGGQRHRVALARAIYAKTRILVLDDFLGALDSRTACEIFRNLFNEGGVQREMETTVSLATHSIQFLPAADIILRFDGNGQVSAEPGEGRRDIPNTDAQNPAHNTTRPESVLRTNAYSNNTIASMTEMKMNAESPRPIKPSTYSFFFSMTSGFQVALFLFATLLNTTCEKAAGIFLRVWLDRNPANTSFFTGYAVIGFAPTLTYIAMAIVFYQYIVPRYSESLHKLLVDTIFSAKLSFLTSSDHGSLVSRISNDMTLVSQQLARDIFRFPYTVFNILADIAILASVSYYALLLVPLLLSALYIIQLVYLTTSRQLQALDVQAKTSIYTQLMEVGCGTEHIRAFGWHTQYTQRAERAIDQEQRLFLSAARLQRWLGISLDCLNLAVSLVLTCLAIYWGDETTETGIGLAFLSLLSLSESFTFLAGYWVDIETSMSSVERVRVFVNETPLEHNGPTPAQLPDTWAKPGTIGFKDVTAKYRSEKGSKMVFKNVTMGVLGGKKAGLTGRTGSGKSSLILALLGFLDYEGSITIDDHELCTIPRDILRQRVLTIPQENLVLPGTIRQNLLPWTLNNPYQGQIDDPMVLQVLASLNLGDKVNGSGGLNASMERLGLSVGERQLFALAHAILCKTNRNNGVVLMDEAMSGIDPEMEQDIREAVEAAFHDCTLFVISHRQAAVDDAAYLYEMKDSTMVQTRGPESTFANRQDDAAMSDAVSDTDLDDELDMAA